MKRRKTISEELSWSFFDHLNNITFTKRLWSDIDPVSRKSWNLYLGIRYLSMDSSLISLVESTMNLLYNLPTESSYNCLVNLIPKQKRFLKYVGSKKKVAQKPLSILESIADIQAVYAVSRKQAIEYYNIISQQDPLHLDYLAEINGRIDTGTIFPNQKIKTKRSKKTSNKSDSIRRKTS